MNLVLGNVLLKWAKRDFVKKIKEKTFFLFGFNLFNVKSSI